LTAAGGRAQFGDLACGREKVIGHLGTGQERPELLQRDEHLAVEGTRIAARLDVDEADLSAVRPRGEVAAGVGVRVVEAKPSGKRRECDAPHAVRWDERRALFRRAIDVARQEHPMPVELFGGVSVVVHVHDHLLSLGQAQQRPGKAARIELGRDNRVVAQLDQPDADAQRMVSRRVGRTRSRLLCRSVRHKSAGKRRCSGQLKHATTIEGHKSYEVPTSALAG